MSNIQLDTRRKALQVNLDDKIYGTFAEIGAGQEVARHFFMAGAASGTVAKAMSAYDMTFSNEIYGVEESGRYVSKSRLVKMLDHEYELLTDRLVDDKYSNRAFFAFANTVTTLNYDKTNDPHGWIGIKFQRKHNEAPSEVIFHVRLLDSDSHLQQHVLGILGVNLVYAVYNYHKDVRQMVESLADNLSKGSVEIDLIHVNGPAFKNVDNIIINLYLVQKGYSTAALFSPEGEVMQAKDLLYKKHVLMWRTRFHQKVKPNYEMFECVAKEYIKVNKLEDKQYLPIAELTLRNLISGDADTNDVSCLEEVVRKAKDFMDNGYTVLISDFTRTSNLVNYLMLCKPKTMGVATNIVNLKHVFTEEKYPDSAIFTNEVLAFASDMFSKDVKMFVYPYVDAKTKELVNTNNLPISPKAKHLYEFLLKGKYITDIKDYTDSALRAI